MKALFAWPIMAFRRAAHKIAACRTTVWLLDCLQSFYETKSKKEAGEKIAWMGITVPTFNYLMWLLTGVTFTLVGIMREWGLGFWIMFLVLWPGNIALCWWILWVYNKTSIDFTLSETYRRLTNQGMARSRVIGILLEFWFCLSLIVWAGAASFCIYHKDRLEPVVLRVFSLVFVSAIQMSLWVYIFMMGYDGISELIRMLI